MTINELNDNFATHADAIYAATAQGIGLEYTGQAAIRDTVRDVLFTLSNAHPPRNWGGMEAAAKAAIEDVLNGAKPVESFSIEVVDDRIQGVDCMACEEDAPHIHKPVKSAKPKSKR